MNDQQEKGVRNHPSLNGAFAWPWFQLMNSFKVCLCPAVLVGTAGNSLSPAASLCCPFLGCEHFLLKGFHLIPCKLSGVVQSDLFCKPYAVDWNCFSSSWCVAAGSAAPPLHAVHRGCDSHHGTKPQQPWALLALQCRLCLPVGKPAPGSFQGAGGKKTQADCTHIHGCLKGFDSWKKTRLQIA